MTSGDPIERHLSALYRISGWRGGRILMVLIAAMWGLPTVFGRGSHAAWDWSLPFVTLAFVVIPAACLAHVLVTLVIARYLRGRRLAVELTALVVPVTYVVLGYLGLT